MIATSEPTSAEEGAARTVWVVYLMAQVGGTLTHELIQQAAATLEALPIAERPIHQLWRDIVIGSLENTLRGLLPAVAVTDESPVPSDPDATLHGRNAGIGVPPPPRPTIIELGYFEGIGRLIGGLPKAQRIRVLVASLVTYAYEADLPPVELSIMVTRAARRYFARLRVLSSPGPYDGHGLIGYAFPPEKLS